MSVLGASLTLLGFGCATGGSELRHGIGAGQWEARLPTTQSPIQAMAYGSGGGSERAADVGVSAALAALDRAHVTEPPMAAEAAPQRVAAHKSKPAPSEVAAAPVALTKAAENLPASPPPPTELAKRVEVQEPMALAAHNANDSRYAEREIEAKEQQRFAGGDAIVITSGAILLVLLVVLLIFLLR